MLDCPQCEDRTLSVVGTDVSDNNIGLRRYQCSECRNRYLTVESFFLDDNGDPDAFLQLALNTRLADREAHRRRTGKKARRVLKPTDNLLLLQRNGLTSIRYLRSAHQPTIFLECKRGHALEGDNLYVNPKSGARTCKACRRINQHNFNMRPETKARRRAAWARIAPKRNAERRKPREQAA